MIKRIAALAAILCLLAGSVDCFASAELAQVVSGESFAATDTTNKTVTLTGENTFRTDKTIVVRNDQDSDFASLHMDEDGMAEWHFTAAAGRYTIQAVYYPQEGGSATINRRIQVNGVTPDNLVSVVFPRRWVDVLDAKGEFFTDVLGNQLTPKQQQSPAWMTAFLADRTGFQNDPLYVDLKDGDNSLAILGEGGLMALKELRLIPNYSVPTYSQAEENYANSAQTSNLCLTYDAEKPAYKSTSSITATSDRASASVEPSGAYLQKMNVIGGSQWKTLGEYLVWKIDAPQAGLYAITLKARKNTSPGYVTYRRLYIDGKVPFDECNALPFAYSLDWQNVTLGEDQPYLFYLEKGTHEIKLEATVGDMDEIVKEASRSVLNLNAVYRKFLVVIGSEPDIYRDYQLDKKTPDLIRELRSERDKLQALYQRMLQIVPEKGGAFGTLDLMLDILNRMTTNSRNIPRYFTQFKTYLGSYATWLATAMESPLQLDTLYIHSINKKLPSANVCFFKSIKHFFEKLIASYMTDYNTIGRMDSDSDNQQLTVWMTGGRDQFQVMQSLLVGSDLQKQGISANLKLVSAGILLKSIMAGSGPDVMLTDSSSEIINYALRGAVTDLNRFDDIQNVLPRFNKDTLVPLMLEGKLYALPVTMSYNVLFYRRDIIEEMKINIPKTWADVTRVISLLGKSNLQFGIPTGVDMYFSFLSQSDGKIYNERGSKVAFDDRVGIEAFRKWTSYYSDYGVAYEYDFQNRFRTGIMPIGIAPFSYYSNLVVAAPEIAGLWDFTLLPGTEKPDGSVDRTSCMTVTGSLILDSSKKREVAWEFLKWWTSAKVQADYGNGVENILGASGRYATANIEAMSYLPWSNRQKTVLSEQLKQSCAIPEVPGGYLMSRGLTFAFRSVVVNKSNPKNTLLDQVKTINEELYAKRMEFQLPPE